MYLVQVVKEALIGWGPTGSLPCPSAQSQQDFMSLRRHSDISKDETVVSSDLQSDVPPSCTTCISHIHSSDLISKSQLSLTYMNVKFRLDFVSILFSMLCLSAHRFTFWRAVRFEYSAATRKTTPANTPISSLAFPR